MIAPGVARLKWVKIGLKYQCQPVFPMGMRVVVKFVDFK